MVTYLFFGALTTIVYLLIRFIVFEHLKQSALIATISANLIAILFAFTTNDHFVFKQAQQGRLKRLSKFTTARLATLVLDLFLAYILIDTAPHLIGQFVDHNPTLINMIESLTAQALIISGNYMVSKYFIFTNQKG